MRRKNHTHQQDIDDLKRQNALLEQQGNNATSPVTVFLRVGTLYMTAFVFRTSVWGSGEVSVVVSIT